MEKINKIIYAGHSAIFFQTTNKTIAIDPWLLGNPLCPEKLQTPENLDAIILSHGHEDHAGDAVRLAKNYGCKIFSPYELGQILIQEGVNADLVVPMNKGGCVKYDGVSISLMNAFHSSSYKKSSGETVYAGEPCSILLRDGKTSIFHAGDTALFSDLTLIGELFTPDIALLPIGDCFTMGPKHATIAAKMLKAKVNIPIHHSTFGLLTGKPEDFVENCKKESIETAVIAAGASFEI